ncbi:MAG: hypothetical protein IT376_14825 [Polyangiaceae bacterium]|nr:hypothetical protein [Polyangiaceae bacterium]
MTASASSGVEGSEGSLGASVPCRPRVEPPVEVSGPERLTADTSNLRLRVGLRDSSSSALRVSAMVLSGATHSKVLVSPSWLAGSGSEATLSLPIDSLAPSASVGDRVTVAFEVTSDAGAAWSNALQLERGAAGWVAAQGTPRFDAVPADKRAEALPVGIPAGVPPLAPSPGAPAAPGALGSAGPGVEVEAVPAGRAATPAPRSAVAARQRLADRAAPRVEMGAAAAQEVYPLASSTTLCFQQMVLMNGEGVGEDYLNADAMYGSAGMWVSVSGVWGGYLSSSGCTPPLNLTSGSRSITAYTQVSLNSRVARVDTNDDGAAVAFTWNANVTAGGTQTVGFWPLFKQEQFNVSMFAAIALWYNPGTWTGTHHFHALNTVQCGGGSCNSGGEVYIGTNGGFDKFLVGHEHGHLFFDKNTAVAWWGDYSDDTHAPPCNAGGSTGHDVDSREFSSTTFNEAAASFYGAATFNSTGQDDCAFYHPRYPNGIDCENGQAWPDYDLPLSFMELRCPTPWAGRGVEVDWLRALWDVRTDGASPPSLNTVLAWIDLAPAAFTRDNAYTNLDAAANTAGGVLNTNWDAAKGPNGVDH